jgi:hypothetical protein
MVNRYKPHIYVIPEDDANRQILNGFLLWPNLNSRAIQVLRPVGGWLKVMDEFRDVHAPEMQRYPQRMVLLVIDFDGHQDRLDIVKKDIPKDLSERVFILGVLSKPERLRIDTQKPFEAIGQALAEDCSNDTNVLWAHNLLKHNKIELDRMIPCVKPVLFSQKSRWGR